MANRLDEFDELEKAIARLKLDDKPHQTNAIGDTLFAKTLQPVITANNLISYTEHFTQAVIAIKPHELKPEDYQQYKRRYKQLRQLYSQPRLVSGAQPYGGVRKIFQSLEAKFLKASRCLVRLGRYFGDEEATFDPIELTLSECEQVVSGFSKLARLYKYKKAYAGFREGKKFKKSTQLPPTNKGIMGQSNPIAELSTQNLNKLINELTLSGNKDSLYGLRADEKLLFKLLLDLPWQCQHATNYFYPIANSGSLDSYTELLRRQPDYASPFSTKGNIAKLGNGGFVFFRVFVEGVNSATTRYGDSRIFADLSVFSQIGCVSLHDQLIPVSKASVKSMYWDKRLLRMAETVNIHNQTSEKSLRDGIKYSYRTNTIPTNKPFTGARDTLKGFHDSNKTTIKSRTISFTEEMFFGSDILLGITLSVIRELRWLEDCGFRGEFIKKLYSSDRREQINQLGDLVKRLFRIEAKYPVSLRLANAGSNTRYRFEPLGIFANERAELLTIDNPDGDRRYKPDQTINHHEMKLGLLKQEKYRLEGELSVLRRQVGKFKEIPKSKQEYQEKLDNAQRRYVQVNNEIAGYYKERNKAENFFAKYHDSTFDLSKVNTKKLLILYQHFADVFEFGFPDIDIVELFKTPMNKLELIIDEQIMELINNGQISYTQLSALSIEEMTALIECSDLKYAFYDHGYSLEDLMNLYHENPMNLVYLTTSNPTDLLLETAPDIPTTWLKEAKRSKVDFSWMREQLCESDAILLDMALDDACEDIAESDEFRCN